MEFAFVERGVGHDQVVLGDGDHVGVDQSQAQDGVVFDQLHAASVVGDGRVDDDQFAGNWSYSSGYSVCGYNACFRAGSRGGLIPDLARHVTGADASLAEAERVVVRIDPRVVAAAQYIANRHHHQPE